MQKIDDIAKSGPYPRIKKEELGGPEELARILGEHRTTVRQILPLAFLSPEITKLILQGKQPSHLSLALLTRTELPLAWEQQKTMMLGA
jgi:hypothetical protein